MQFYTDVKCHNVLMYGAILQYSSVLVYSGILMYRGVILLWRSDWYPVGRRLAMIFIIVCAGSPLVNCIHRQG